MAAIATVAVLTYRNRVALYSWMPKSLPALPTFFKAAAKNPSVTINVAFAPAASAISSAAGKIAEAAAPAAAQVAQALVSK